MRRRKAREKAEGDRVESEACMSRDESLGLQAVIAKADAEELLRLALSFGHLLLRMADDPEANFVVTALIDRSTPRCLAVLSPFVEREFLAFATSRYACRAVNAILRKGAGREAGRVASLVTLRFRQLIGSYFGHYVVVACIQHCYSFRAAIADVFVEEGMAMPAQCWLDIALAFMESAGVAESVRRLVARHIFETAAQVQVNERSQAKLVVLLKKTPRLS